MTNKTIKIEIITFFFVHFTSHVCLFYYYQNLHLQFNLSDLSIFIDVVAVNCKCMQNLFSNNVKSKNLSKRNNHTVLLSESL